MGGLFGSTPDAPDPYQTAAAEANVNRLNQYTPTGNIFFGNYDESGNFIPTPNRETVMVQETPQQQALRQAGYNLSMGTLENLGGMAQPRTAQQIRDILPSFQGLNQGTPDLRSSQSIEQTLSPAGSMANFGQGLQGLDLSGLSTNFSADSQAAADATFNLGLSQLQPQFEQQRSQTQAELLARGIPVNSEAYRNEMNRVESNQGRLMNELAQSSILAGRNEQGRLYGQELARLGAAQGVRGQQFGEQTTGINLAELLRGNRLQEGLSLAGLEGAQRGQLFGENMSQAQAALQKQLALAGLESQQRTQTINELLGLQTGQQVQAPQAVNIPGVNLSGLVNANYQAQAQNAAANNQALGSLLGSGTMAGAMFFSDARLKHHIIKVGEKDGLGVYEFEYRGQKGRYRGVMAQEVLRRKPDAVHRFDGYLAVDYGKLSIPFERVS